MRLHLATLFLAATTAAHPAAAQSVGASSAAQRQKALAPLASASARAERLIDISRVPARVLGTASTARSSGAGALVEMTYSDSYNPITGTWTLNGRTDYAYTSGLLSSVTERYWMAGAWTNVSRTEATYDGDRVSSSRYDSWDGTGWVPNEQETYTYNGTTSHDVVSARWQGGSWQPYERMQYTLRNGIVVEGTRDTLRSGTWTPVDRFTFVESSGAVVQTNGEHNGTAWVATDRRIYENQTFQSLNAAYAELEASLVVGGTFSYVLPDYREELWTGTAWEFSSRQTSTRTAGGRPQTVTFADWDGMAWEDGSRSVFAYGAGDVLASATVELPGEDGWEPIFSEIYVHENGRLTEATTRLHLGPEPMPQARSRFVYVLGTRAPADEAPLAATLAAPAPNPVRGTATLAYVLEAPGEATLALYDLTGRRVATLARGAHAAGAHTAALDASALPAGVYVARLSTPTGAHATQRVVLAR